MTCDANLSTPRRLLTSTVPKVACLRIKPGTILNFFKIATHSSTSLMKIRWPPPPSIAMVHRLPLTLSPLQVSPPVASMSGSSSLARPRSPYRFSSLSQRYDQRVASSAIPVLGSRPRYRESLQPTSPRRPSSQRRSTSRRSSSPRRTPSPAQRRVASRRTPPLAQRSSSRRTPSPTQRRVASKGSPPPQRVTVDPTQGSSSAKRPLSGGSSLEDGHPGTPSLQGEVPLLRNDGVMRRETLSPLQLTTLHGLPLESPRRKDQGHGLLLSKLPLPERRRKLKTLRFQPRWNSSELIFRMPSLPRLRSSPGHLMSQPLSVLLTQRLPRDRFLAGLR